MPAAGHAVRHLVIGNPANRRILLFQAALQRCGQAPATVVSYLELLRDVGAFARLRQLLLRERCEGPTCLRVESPGEDFDVERQLIARGAGRADPRFGAAGISRHAALRLRPDRGRILYPAQWLAGYADLLGVLAASIDGLPGIQRYHAVADILTMFHKPDCHRRLAAGGVPVPAALYGVASFEDLRERMRERSWRRVFVKLASGSSASGVLALVIDGPRLRAVTSMEAVGSGARTRYYNSLKLQVCHREREIRTAIDFLCRETAHVEQWLPKAHQAGRNFDLRIVTIGGRPRHLVVRTSPSPLTNLHLGNRRGDAALLRAQMGPSKWQDLMDAATLAARVFPDSLCVGLDILLQPGFRQPTLLEANAFGDLLPGVTDQGLDTYEAQIEVMAGSV